MVRCGKRHSLNNCVLSLNHVCVSDYTTKTPEVKYSIGPKFCWLSKNKRYGHIHAEFVMLFYSITKHFSKISSLTDISADDFQHSHVHIPVYSFTHPLLPKTNTFNLFIYTWNAWTSHNINAPSWLSFHFHKFTQKNYNFMCAYHMCMALDCL